LYATRFNVTRKKGTINLVVISLNMPGAGEFEEVGVAILKIVVVAFNNDNWDCINEIFG